MTETIVAFKEHPRNVAWIWTATFSGMESLRSPTRFQEARIAAALSKSGNTQRDLSHSRLPDSLQAAIAIGLPSRRPAESPPKVRRKPRPRRARSREMK